MKLTIGADPELFIKDNKTGKLISAADLFPGTKEAPHPVMHGGIQVDGMAAEYNILPSSTREEFIFNNISVLRSLRDSIKENNPKLDFDFVFTPVADFGAEYIAQQSDVAKALGCTPDYNAYANGQANPTPDAEMPFRTASGHIHIGWTNDQDINDPEHIEACCMMVKQLDCYVGLQLFELEGLDGKRRRDLYGKAGAFRPKSYGVEYRTPSNTWLKATHTMSRTFRYAKDAFDNLLDGNRAYEQSSYKAARTYIDTYNVKDKNYYIGGGWLEPGYREVSESVSLKSLDELFIKYSKYDTTGKVTPELIAEIKAAQPVIPRAKRKADRLDDRKYYADLKDIPLLGINDKLEFDGNRNAFFVRRANELNLGDAVEAQAAVLPDAWGNNRLAEIMQPAAPIEWGNPIVANFDDLEEEDVVIDEDDEDVA